MDQSQKIESFVMKEFIGYRRLEWMGLEPRMNLLVGQNGVGKSHVLEALVLTLNALDGLHMRDAVSKTYPRAAFEIQLAGEHHPRHVSSQAVRAIQGEQSTDWTCHILQIVENRQPKNQLGLPGPPHRRNPQMRYAEALSRLKRWLEPHAPPEDGALANEVLAACRSFPEVAPLNDWDWIAREVLARPHRRLRPVSCGQFDLIALMTDLIQFRHQIDSRPAPAFVMFDNPETYIHSSALWPLLDRFLRVLPEAQFFVASHNPKALLYPSKSVYWFARAPDRDSGMAIENVRNLVGGARNAFFELYGDDVQGGVLSMIGLLETQKMSAFLARCVHECYAKPGRKPGGDPQLIHAARLIDDGMATILDVGAGRGDLLLALMSLGRVPPNCTYVGFEILDPRDPSGMVRRDLETCIKNAVGAGAISPASRMLTSLEEGPRDCDVAVLMNVCHHLRIPELAGYLSDLLNSHIVKRVGAGILVVELRTLAEGERNFLLWTPEEYAELFSAENGIGVTRDYLDGTYPAEGIEATKILWTGLGPWLAPPAAALEVRLWKMLPVKRDKLLAELAAGRGQTPLSGAQERWRQLRVAFICAQVTWIDAAEHERRISGEGLD